MQERNSSRVHVPLNSLELSSDSESVGAIGAHERFFMANSEDLHSPETGDIPRVGTSSTSLSQRSLRVSPQSSFPSRGLEVRDLVARQTEFESDVQESLNMLTDRINGIEFECEERWGRCDSSIKTLRAQFRTIITGLVKKIIKLVQLISFFKDGSLVRNMRDRVQSRIGMNRARIVTPRE